MTDLFGRRRNAYRRLFRQAEGQAVGDGAVVLADLRRFARLPDAPLVRNGAGASDVLATGVMMGRQEVVNRILAYLNLDEAAVFKLREIADE